MSLLDHDFEIVECSLLEFGILKLISSFLVCNSFFPEIECIALNSLFDFSLFELRLKSF